MHVTRQYLAAASLLLLAATATSAQPQPHLHDRFGTTPADVRRDFIAFSVSFDGDDDGVAMGVPEWVAYELRATPADLGPAPARPSKWFTDTSLHTAGIAPNDDSYKNSGYSRGHLCMKSHAHRISDEADTETHTVLNACPQLQSMNGGVWLSLENLTGQWADTYGAVWIVTGPVFLPDRERSWIGDPGEVPVAIPDAFYKVVVREGELNPHVLAFVIPMEGDETHSRQTADVRPFLTSVDIIEALTGLDFLTSLPDSEEEFIEQRVFTELWSSTSPVLAERPPPAPAPAAPQPPVVNPSAEVSLREGITASAAEQDLAKQIKAAGWEYTMPRPKSAQAAWGNTDGRTTWWNGYWHNRRTGQYSSRQPVESDGFAGDGVNNSGWRRGGSPGAPSRIEWLCSTSGGIPPR